MIQIPLSLRRLSCLPTPLPLAHRTKSYWNGFSSGCAKTVFTLTQVRLFQCHDQWSTRTDEEPGCWHRTQARSSQGDALSSLGLYWNLSCRDATVHTQNPAAVANSSISVQIFLSSWATTPTHIVGYNVPNKSTPVKMKIEMLIVITLQATCICLFEILYWSCMIWWRGEASPSFPSYWNKVNSMNT